MNLPHSELLATLEFHLAPLFEDYGIPLAIMGVLVVFLALALVVSFITILPRVATWIIAGAAPEPPPTVKFDPDELPEDLVVVIAAAVAAMIQQPHRIVRIRGLTSEDLGWSLEGRTQHHQSHRIQPRAR